MGRDSRLGIPSLVGLTGGLAVLDWNYQSHCYRVDFATLFYYAEGAFSGCIYGWMGGRLEVGVDDCTCNSNSQCTYINTENTIKNLLLTIALHDPQLLLFYT
jgi:hypothetical protein